MKRFVARLFFVLGGLLANLVWGQIAIMPELGGANVGAAGSAVKAEAMLDTTGIMAGTAFTLAVTLTTNPGYHIYWSNPGESGLPTTFKLELPAGFKSEAMPFPVPMKFVQPGNITGYGYTGRTTFLFTITPPSGLKAEVGPISAAATWLCCDKAQCVPGSAKLEVPVVVGGGQAANGEVFAAARAALPLRRNPPEVKLLQPNRATVRDGGPMMQSLGWNITWASEKQPENVEFFPADLEGLKVDKIEVATIPSGEAAAMTRVNVRAHVMQGQTLGDDSFTGLIAFKRADGARVGFVAAMDVRSLAQTQPAATKP